MDLPSDADQESPTLRRRSRRRLGMLAICLVVTGSALAVSTTVWSFGESPGDAARGVRSTTTDGDDATTSAAPPTTVVAPTTAPPTTAPPPPPTPPLRVPSPDAPLRVWVSGDSTGWTIGRALQRANVEGLFALELEFKVSSGLSRPDFFDWPFYLQAVVQTHPPEVLVMTIGDNDNQAMIAPDGTLHDPGTEGWIVEYRRRVDAVNQILTAGGTRVYWIGQPIARDPGYSAYIAMVNDIYRQVADAYDGTVYIDAWAALANDDGSYTDDLIAPDGQPVRVRQSDGIHVTDVGGDVMVGPLVEAIRRDWGG